MNIKEEGQHKTSKAHRAATARYNYKTDYNRKHMKQIALSFHQENEAPVLSWLEQQPNKNGYIKSLILADMAKHKSST